MAEQAELRRRVVELIEGMHERMAENDRGAMDAILAAIREHTEAHGKAPDRVRISQPMAFDLAVEGAQPGLFPISHRQRKAVMGSLRTICRGRLVLGGAKIEVRWDQPRDEVRTLED